MGKVANRFRRDLSGTMSITCSECDEACDVRVKKGVLRLPAGWVWFELGCNWGSGYTLQPRHAACCGA